MRSCARLASPFALAIGVATCALSLPLASSPPGYAPSRGGFVRDTLRGKVVKEAAGEGNVVRALGAVIPGYLSSRGLPPVQGQFTLTDSGLVFRSASGSIAHIPLFGSVREIAGRKSRPSSVGLAYIDESGGRPVYVFRVDAGVFETDEPGVLLEIASHPVWLDSLRPSNWVVEPPLVSPRDTAGMWATARGITRGSYADSLYALFGRPKAVVGLIGARGRRVGRLGEYIARRDSVALDPGHITGQAQLRHTLAHELGHRWQSRAPSQVATLWRGVEPVRDPRRYGYGVPSEHQAEAIAFAVDFLQTTAGEIQAAATSLRLLDHYELLVPGTRIMVRYLALQPIYRRHPLRSSLTTGDSR